MSLLSRLKGLLQIQRLEQDLDDELLSHVEMRAEENLAAGMSPAEARYDAQRRFGNSTLLKERRLQYMSTGHLPMIPVLLAVAMVVELGGSVCLITGR